METKLIISTIKKIQNEQNRLGGENVIKENEVLKLYNDGLNSCDIAKRIGISEKVVYKVLSCHNLKSHNIKPFSPRKITDCELAKAINLYRRGCTLAEIVSLLELDCSSSAIRGLLIRRGIEMRTRGKQSNFNEAYFDTIDDEHKAYWLGFIYADGNLTKNRLRIEIQSRDIEIINNLRKDLNSTNKIIICKNETKDNVGIGFCSDKMAAALNRYGVVENKTFKLKNIPNIPQHLIRHFIRGYFDGDGTVYINSKNNSLRVGFYGTRDLLTSIQNNLHEEIGTSVNKIYEKVGCWLLSYAMESDVKKIYDYLYTDAELFLARKKLKFQEKI